MRKVFYETMLESNKRIFFDAINDKGTRYEMIYFKDKQKFSCTCRGHVITGEDCYHIKQLREEIEPKRTTVAKKLD